MSVPLSKFIIIVHVSNIDVSYKDVTTTLNNTVPAGIYMFQVNNRNTRTNGVVLDPSLLTLGLLLTLF